MMFIVKTPELSLVLHSELYADHCELSLGASLGSLIGILVTLCWA